MAFLSGMGVAALGKLAMRPGWVLAIRLATCFWGPKDFPLGSASPQQVSWKLYPRPAYLSAREAANYLRAQTAPEDDIYVAFAEAQIYYLPRRRAVITQMYMGEVSSSRQLFDQVIASIRARAPE